jgi:hypothetical protein
VNATGHDRVEVGLGERAYQVLIGSGLLDRAGEHLARFARGGRLVVISDETVWALQGGRLAAGLAAGGIETMPILLPPGEGSKDWATLAALVDRLLELGVERSDPLRSSSAAATSYRSRPPCSPRSTARSAARPGSTPPRARIWSARSTSRRWCSPTSTASTRCRRGSCAPATPRS